ncbi:hypothetical protein H8S33_05985 [Ornithinibacillus sp. BX22]|uniref:Uncharacterized protein n=1 Tax=Ornithinibacillus hominis TaxID=2763055 RepID=A0A923L4M2_9BACI|nr:hypothetical protein [Ornithinibacillus hominis]MBC5636377.1 hypothetical protein [Ornithinibacillus hominis]
MSLNQLKSPENYIEYLKNYDEKEAIRLGIDESSVEEAVIQAKKSLDEFMKLSLKDQNLFLEYMRNPNELIQNTLNGSDPNLALVEEVNMLDTPLSNTQATFRIFFIIYNPLLFILFLFSY